jgi:hypothetical protein
MRLARVSLLVVFSLLLAAAPAQADVITYNPAEDAWTTSDQPSSNGGRGADDELWSKSSGPAERAFLEFNVANLPPGSTVNSATLTLRTSGKSYSGSSNGPRLTDSTCFDENTVTHSNAPTAGLQLANYGNWTANSSITVNVPVPGNGVYCYSLEGDSTDDLGVWSSEAPTVSNRPVLRIDYTPPTSTPPPPTAAFTVTPSSPQAGQTVTLNGSSSTCPDGRCTYEYTVNGATLFPTGQTGTWTPTAAGTYTVTLTVRDSSQPAQVDTETKQVTVTAPPAQPQCSDGVNNDPAEDSLVDYPADPGCSSASDTSESPNPPAGGSLIPPNAVLVRQNDHNGSGSISSSQCPSGGSITEQNGYVRLYRPAGGGQAAGGYRCEFQWGSNMANGEVHWIEYRARYPVGFQGGCGSWCAGFQIHEANVSGIGAVDAAMFMQSGFQWDGQAIGPTQNASSVNVTDWHTYTVKAEMSTGSTGRISFWIDGVSYGSTVGRNMTVGGNSYIKYGHYGGNDATREAHFDYVRHYRMP